VSEKKLKGNLNPPKSWWTAIKKMFRTTALYIKPEENSSIVIFSCPYQNYLLVFNAKFVKGQTIRLDRRKGRLPQQCSCQKTVELGWIS
jgi:hypothetical protein